ncbi:UDP-glucose:glycoprotein glucosyltransferase 1-like isoform X1 [Myxocyprinus asiaticus]|uniref:UDP-glucose:glycoprotein glucosyltransferase 1-like isoform X1 n=1 Tax=Myxocyprinus asiaticus TaxID=70543 RepID=UPI002221B879|nr:UDP-glucose:glycoprotein glucosyltransferase 1-like isoform X1 [Myxocyprinus asiaticus]XP_051565830.1 UDP-glucose:glycoprotein glucosyltransferase 1-like isoform X1 [Myxocyprinus asiaticus]XP_051565831.1 UDP-glucose:glycoprotein glucosyltransferase 1-like isoform X1 [Myxocyprinus asiaticus]XP_051565832.1 UDP-glucose:glycoprotein glucosyltransferase 1-like isoform X1 [Myxocyprinus asiaticus]XP_051565833.1 UDP-glucose:glycoprotein glucosyltransferase 1-like isoform X1 [Myxocyprinus asiaticus]
MPVFSVMESTLTWTFITLLDILRGEAKILEGLHDLGIKGNLFSKFLQIPTVSTVEESYALDIRHSAIMWVNYIEKDSMYRHWPSSLQELLRATFSGVIRKIHCYFFFNLAGGVFYRWSGLGAPPLALFSGVPFSSEEMDPEELEIVLMQCIMETADFFQRAIFMGQITEGVDVVDFLMEQTNVVPRINPLILNSGRRYLDFTASPVIKLTVADDWDDTTMFSYMDSRDKFFIRDEEEVMYNETMWIVVDIEQAPGRQLLWNTLKHMKSIDSNCHVGVINNPSGKPFEDNSGLYRAVWSSHLTQSSKNTLDFTLKLLKEENTELLKQGTKIKHLLKQGMDQDAFEKKFSSMEVDFLHSKQKFCKEVLKLKAGQRAVVINGRGQ